MTAKTFGKRAPAAPVRRMPVAAPEIARPPVPAARVVEAAPVAAERPVGAAAAPPSSELPVDEELRRWKAERSQTLFYRLPWKQFSLFASISFGVASFVLPDSVNDAVNYLLWGLSLIGFAIWIGGFFRKKAQ